MGSPYTHMDLVARNWTSTSTTAAIAGSLHGVAILSTLFRLWYRWSLASMWWDDGWAVIALFADIASLASVILEQPVPGGRFPYSNIGQWITFCAFPTIMWTTRLSILTSMVRISQPRGVLKWVAICIGLAFGMMWICAIGQRLEACIYTSCGLTIAIAAVQTATDGVADILLTTLPILFLRHTKLCRKCKNLILSTFSASMVINVVTILHATVLFKPVSLESVILAHVKTALSMTVCNLLVVVTFVYRFLHRRHDREDASTVKSCAELTTIELSEAAWSHETSKGTSLPVCSSETMSPRSSTWSFTSPSPMASKLSGVASEMAGTGTMQGEIVQEAR